MKQFLLSFNLDFGPAAEPALCGPQDQDFSQGQVFYLDFDLAEFSVPIPSSGRFWLYSSEYWRNCSDSR